MAILTRTNLDSEQWESFPSVIWLLFSAIVMCYSLNTVLIISLRGAVDILAITSIKPLNLPKTSGEKGILEAMEQNEDKVLQHLAFYEFEGLHEGDKGQRQFAYELSNPGVCKESNFLCCYNPTI